MSENKIAITARKAMHDDAFVSEPGCCQMFVREIIDAVYGPTKFAMFRADSAKHAAEKWMISPYVINHDEKFEPVPGDLLYKTHGSGGFGHVGICVGRLYLDTGDSSIYVAENASTTIGRVSGAKGYRSLIQFGLFDVVVRLPHIGVDNA